MLADDPAPLAGGEEPVREDEEDLVQVTGTMKWFDATRGFGFLVSDDIDGDVLVHFSVLKSMTGAAFPKARSSNAWFRSRKGGSRPAGFCPSISQRRNAGSFPHCAGAI
jgi:hypothetical protein